MINIVFNTAKDSKKLQDHDASKHRPLNADERGLDIIPHGSGMGWFSDSRGPFFYNEFSGNFMIETGVDIYRLDGNKGMPKAQFSSAGLLMRNMEQKKGKAVWVMYNIGFQNSFWGREIKVTRKRPPFRFDPYVLMGLKSLSTLYLVPDEYRPGPYRLRLARVNGEVRAYYMDYEGKWRRETPSENMEVMGNGTNIPVEGFSSDEFSPVNFGLEDKVQAGIIANPGMNMKNPFVKFRDSGYRFLYFSAREIESFDECTG